jgi:hypothetical protein
MRRRRSELDSLPFYSLLFFSMFSDSTATANNTYISIGSVEDDVDVDEEKMKLLKKYNTGRIKSRNRVDQKVARREDHLALLQSIASTLRLTTLQKTKAKKFLTQILEQDIRGEKIEEVCFSVCAIVANQDADGKRWWNGREKGDDERFEEFVNSNDLSPNATFGRVKKTLEK